MHLSTAVLIGVGGLFLTAVGTCVVILGYRRSGRSSELTDFKTKVDLWELEISRLKDQNVSQAEQIRSLEEGMVVLTAKNKDLSEMATSAPQVVELTNSIGTLIETVGKWVQQSQQNHNELLALLGRQGDERK